MYTKKWYLLIGLVLSVFVIQSCKSSISRPIAHKGIIDLRSWDFDKDGSINLNGEWEFYWEQFINDSIPTSNPNYIEVPSLWNDESIGETKISGTGYASYKLVLLVNTNETLALKYKNSATSCNIFIDGVSVFEAGKPGRTKVETIPSYKPGVVSFIPKSDRVELVLHLANFHHYKGGQWEPLRLGQQRRLYSKRNQYLFADIFLIGCILIVCFLQLVVYITHRKEKPSLYFGFFALFISARFWVSGEFSIYQVGDFKWEYLVRADYLSFYVAILFFALYICEVYKKYFNRLGRNIVLLISSCFALSVVVFPTEVFTHGMIYFQIFLILICLYATYYLIVATKNKHNGADYFLAGFILLFIFAIHDILNENEVLHSVNLSSAGLTLFIISQAAFLASKILTSLQENTELSARLTVQNSEYLALNKQFKRQNKKLKKAKEKAEESDRFKSAFLANISHEIRTPMNGILGFSELLASKDLDEAKRQKYAGILKERGTYLLGIVNDIIDVSKIETGQVVIHEEETNVNDLLNFVLESYNSRSELRKLQLKKSFPLNGGSENIVVDKQKLQQIFENLLSNAFKFTRKGFIEIGYHRSGNYLLFYVKDTGIGIKEEEIKHIFDRFSQANNKIARKYGGTGLGLSIVKAFIEKMGGQIWVKSVKNEGSEFYFTIPYIVPSPKINKNVLLDENAKESLQILLVEDTESNAFLIMEMLNDLGVDIIRAENGVEAMDLFNDNENLDIVLMDIKLPDTDGLTLTKRMKAIRKNIPIIAQTAFVQKEDKDKAYAAGCDFYLTKPIEKEDLVAAINKLSKSKKI